MLVLLSSPSLSSAGVERLLCNLIREEVTNLPRAVYSLSKAIQKYSTELVNYNHLP